ncbi:hypothetical protein GCM10009722_31990 [Williamsia deligens]|nr:hypothetical protein [Williamsia deligens]
MVGAAVGVAAVCLTACTTPVPDATPAGESTTRVVDRSPRSPGGSPTSLTGNLAGRELEAAALSPDGTRMAAVVEALAGRLTAAAPGYGTGSTITRRGPTELWVWDVRSGARLVTAPIAPVRAMSFLPGGDRVLVDNPHHRGALLRAIDVTTGQETARYGVSGEGNPDGTDGGGPSGHTPATLAMVAVSPDGRRLATYAGYSAARPATEPFDGVGQTVRLWDADPVRINQQLAPVVGATVSFPPAISERGIPRSSASCLGETAASSPSDRQPVRSADHLRALRPRPSSGASTPTPVGRPPSRPPSTAAIPRRSPPRSHPDGTRLAVSSVATAETADRLGTVVSRTVTTTDVATGRRLGTATIPPTTTCESDETVEYSPTGTTFLVAGCGLSVYDSADPRDRRLLQSPDDAAHCDLGTTAQFSGDGTRVTGSGPCGVRVWDASTGRVVASTG